ncbi:MAG: sodium:proton antiporter NhaD [Pseudomonadota bacterium]|nr:sodium:proton antiporter NhaD [Pseudomonadota bacterium]
MFRKQITPTLAFALFTILIVSVSICDAAFAASADAPVNVFKYGFKVDLSNTWVGYLCIAIFAIAYVCVIFEENIHLRKSKPVMVAAGLIWILVAYTLSTYGDTQTAHDTVRHNLLEFAELFLFLLAAMTYINSMDERGVFDALRGWLISQGFSYRRIFWITGGISFVLSPIADNLTTALLMSTVVIAVAGDKKSFALIACINIVVAANAGGAFSPFVDITTLMVWQKGLIQFQTFFVLFIPSLVNWLIPAVIMNFALPSGEPDPIDEKPQILEGAWVIVGLFILTIILAVSFHQFLHLPPVVGMMTGLGILKLYGYFLSNRDKFFPSPSADDIGESSLLEDTMPDNRDPSSRPPAFNVFKALQRAEWDTLMFFYGIILAVGGLGALGYLSLGSNLMYGDLGQTNANILVGVLSAIFDNIPIMFAVLSVLPDMSQGQWLLVTLTAGVGGSMLSIGSAAGVAVMGQARGLYTFFGHLKWTWAIALGYAASIWAHFLVNAGRF